jgi:hypothetical protein
MDTIFKNVKSDRQFSATTGLSRDQFYELKNHFEITEDNYFSDQLVKKDLTTFLDTPSHRLFFILFFLKTYPTNDVLGISFGMDGTTAQRLLTRLTPILEDCLKGLAVLPARSFQDNQELNQALGHCEQLLIDATERRSQRPVNQEKQKEAYSGKKNAIPLKTRLSAMQKK